MISSSSQVDVIIYHDNKVYTGSYEINDGMRTGTIEMFTNSMDLIRSCITSGTFDIKIHSKSLYACTSNSIIKYDLLLNEISKQETDFLNTFVSIHENYLFVCTSKGSIDVYNQDLNFEYSFSISSDILWTNIFYKSFLVCGGEDSILYFVDLKSKSIHKSLQFDQGVTSLAVCDKILLMGSYDEHIYKINNFEILSRHFIGGGVWRIKIFKELYYISCMYEGVKVLTSNFDLLHVFDIGDLVYGMDVFDDVLLIAVFYSKKIYKLNIK
ncbi:hypothetical protein P3W45_001007 [Vairimorpha bombi]